VTPEKLREVLDRVAAGSLGVEEALRLLRDLPFADLGFAKVDQHRGLRNVVSEVLFGEGKSAAQIVAITERLAAAGDNVLITRLAPAVAAQATEELPELRYFPEARVAWLRRRPPSFRGRGAVLIVAAGTADLPVAEEAALTAEFVGNEVRRLYDVGVAGIHRLFAHRDRLREASVLIVVAGMEGALPSVVGGVVDRPLIAVPTSVGYGASFGGLAALLAMLNSCAAGVTVVNIDNGFGAAIAASMINRA
jgi:hypothetical protein